MINNIDDQDGSSEEPPDADTFKILIATDTHLGYAEKDQVRRQDSIDTFEEVLQIAKAHNVDFILLGGDLFHDNKPSRYSLHSCIELLRLYCMNDRPIQFQLLSDPSMTFNHSRRFAIANYEDQNLNVGMPVFSIAGNHDDVTGNPSLCALDLLHGSGLINFWGKYSTNVENVEVSPLLMRKGNTRLALYGISAIRDERLHHLFAQKKVKFLRPQDDPDSKWFSMLALHQNRVKHSETNYIPESFLPDFLSLVLWGHEHPCRLTPEWVGGSHDMFITQPGSSVATSLSEGEAGDKFIGVLRVHGTKFKLDEIKLMTTRPFLFEHVDLKTTGIDPDEPDAALMVLEHCKERAAALISKAVEQRQNEVEEGCAKRPALPLIRLRVDHSGGYQSFNVQRFGSHFTAQVANPKDIVLFVKTRQPRGPNEKLDMDAMGKLTEDADAVNSLKVEDLVREYFHDATPAAQLLLLSEIGLSEGIKQFVDKDELHAIRDIAEHQVKVSRNYLKKEDGLREEDIDKALEKIKIQRAKQNERMEAQRVLNEAPSRPAQVPPVDDEDMSILIDGGDDGDSFPPETSRRGRGSRGGRRPRGTRARGRGSRGSRAGAEVANTSAASHRRATGASKTGVLRVNNASQSNNATLDSHFGSHGDMNRSTATGASKRRFVHQSDDDDSDEEITGPFSFSTGKSRR